MENELDYFYHYWSSFVLSLFYVDFWVFSIIRQEQIYNLVFFLLLSNNRTSLQLASEHPAASLCSLFHMLKVFVFGIIHKWTRSNPLMMVWDFTKLTYNIPIPIFWTINDNGLNDHQNDFVLHTMHMTEWYPFQARE